MAIFYVPKQVYFREALGAVLVYDISRADTFDTIAKVKRPSPSPLAHSFTDNPDGNRRLF